MDWRLHVQPLILVFGTGIRKGRTDESRGSM